MNPAARKVLGFIVGARLRLDQELPACPRHARDYSDPHMRTAVDGLKMQFTMNQMVMAIGRSDTRDE